MSRQRPLRRGPCDSQSHALQAGTTIGDLIADFLSGAAFARVFELGSTVEQGALTLALVVSVALRWFAVTATQARPFSRYAAAHISDAACHTTSSQLLAYTAYREFSVRGPVPVKPSAAAAFLSVRSRLLSERERQQIWLIAEFLCRRGWLSVSATAWACPTCATASPCCEPKPHTSLGSAGTV